MLETAPPLKTNLLSDAPRRPQELTDMGLLWFSGDDYWTGPFSFQLKNNQRQRTYICKGGSRREGRPCTVQHLPQWDRT